MNNCPKCGNPLQEGTNTCPICGTNILENQTSVEQAVAQAPAPSAPEVVALAAPAPAVPEQPVAPAPEVTAPVAPAAPAPVEAVPAQPVAPTPVEAAPAQPVAPVPEVVAPSAPAPAVPEQPVAPTPEFATATVPADGTEAPIETTGILPTVDRVESPTPIPSIPSSITQNTVGLNEEKPLVANPKLEPKKKGKKTPLLVGLALLIVIGIGCFMAFKPSKPNLSKNNQEETPTNALTSMSSNGYHLKIAEGWQIVEDGTNVILTNNDGTVAMKLEHSNSNLSLIQAADIEKIMNSNSSYKDVEVSEIDVSGKNSFLVSTNINQLPVQIFFINGGNNLTIGATIVYQSDDTKSKYESVVMDMIGTLSYTEDSIKALDTLSEYSQMFGIFNNVTYNITHGSDEDTNEDIQPVTEEGQDDQDETGDFNNPDNEDGEDLVTE